MNSELEKRFYENVARLAEIGTRQSGGCEATQKTYRLLADVKEDFDDVLSETLRRFYDQRYRDALRQIEVVAGRKTRDILRDVVVAYIARRKEDGDDTVEFVYNDDGELLDDFGEVWEKEFPYMTLSTLNCSERFSERVPFYLDGRNKPSTPNYCHEIFTVKWSEADPDDVVSGLEIESELEGVPQVVRSSDEPSVILARIVGYVEKYLDVKKNGVEYSRLDVPEPVQWGFISKKKQKQYLAAISKIKVYPGKEIKEIVREIVAACVAAHRDEAEEIFRVYDFDGRLLSNDGEPRAIFDMPVDVLTGLSCVDKDETRGRLFVNIRYNDPKHDSSPRCRREEFYFNWNDVDVDELLERVMAVAHIPLKASVVLPNDSPEETLRTIRENVEYLLKPSRNGGDYSNFADAEYEYEDGKHKDEEDDAPVKKGASKRSPALEGFLEDPEYYERKEKEEENKAQEEDRDNV